MKKSILSALGLILLLVIIRYFYFAPNLVFGEQAPDFKEKDILNHEISLSQFRGSYVLLDFWGSWCVPCRKENKIMVLLYNSYKTAHFKKATGIQFLSVAIESNPSFAEEAIIQDGLVWSNHIIQSEMLKSPIPMLYNIKQIPFKFLIGPDGKIILTNPDIKELDDYLAHNILKN